MCCKSAIEHFASAKASEQSKRVSHCAIQGWEGGWVGVEQFGGVSRWIWPRKGAENVEVAHAASYTLSCSQFNYIGVGGLGQSYSSHRPK